MLQAILVGIVVLVVAAVLFRRRDTGYKVDEFARARALTTEWARRASPEPPPANVPVADDAARGKADDQS